MTTGQRRRYEMFLKVRDFFASHAADFPVGSIAAVIFAPLLPIIEQLAQIAGEQLSTRGSYAQAMEIKGDARDRLYVMLRDISDLATALAYEINGLEEKFRLPRNKSDQNLIAAGRAFAADAAAFEDEFIGYGLSATFIADLIAATDAFEQSLIPANVSGQEKTGKTAAAAPLVDAGMIIVRRLTPVVRKKYRNDAANLAAWEFARHVERTLPKP
ncbi:MAG TPA: hypothetical protein VF604_18990 [Pyrinomonadaceae bacterium]